MSDHTTPTRDTVPDAGGPTPGPTTGSSTGTGTTPASEPDREALLRRDMDEATRAGNGGKDPLRGSRTSGIYAAVIGLGVVLVLLIIFIAQNTRRTTVSFLAWEGQVSVAVALLIAAAAGLFLAGMAGLLRIMQLRRRVKKVNKAVKAQRRA